MAKGKEGSKKLTMSLFEEASLFSAHHHLCKKCMPAALKLALSSLPSHVSDNATAAGMGTLEMY